MRIGFVPESSIPRLVRDARREVLLTLPPGTDRTAPDIAAAASRAGVTVRIYGPGKQLPRMAIIDRTLLVVACNGVDYTSGGLLIRAFEPVDHHLPAEFTAVIEQLALGATDEAAARQLGVGLRTYQRLVAKIMTQLDARSRFQAGYRIASRPGPAARSGARQPR